MEKVLQFLENLSENNNRDWFNNNRKLYQESRDKVLFITEVLINEIRKFDDEINVIDPKDCMFRIFRDVRFSNDKRPYKTNFGSFIAKGGRKSLQAGYYFHIEPGRSFAGGGLYMPPTEQLKSIRSHIAENGHEFLEIIQEKKFKKIYPEINGQKLKTAPKGFPKNHEFSDLLRYQSFTFSTNLKKQIITCGFLIDYLVNAFSELYKINRFINNGLNKFS
ncbi:MAG: DUF2461 domain-containing protein [Bacteroidales bacterium]|jgi:uncharacterized protein (TIGR02453 family)|nr:DUF2461 domain-containing protein [Bacteroidales bacterium]